MNGNVLIIEDEDAIVNVLTSILIANEYIPVVAKDGNQALTMLRSFQPDVVLLDLGLPDIDGVDLLKKMKQTSNCPVLVVSARDNEWEKVEALDLGADDYITKPFGSSELLARIRVALRNRDGGEEKETVSKNIYCCGKLLVDLEKHMVMLDNKRIHLTKNELRIMELLSRNPGKVLTYDYLIKNIWGSDMPENNRILRVNMANIRRKLEENPAEPKYIITEIGVGYRLADESYFLG